LNFFHKRVEFRLRGAVGLRRNIEGSRQSDKREESNNFFHIEYLAKRFHVICAGATVF
jgi:hypothetical protein